MGVKKIYKNNIKDTTQSIKGELHLEGEDFEYEYFLLPIIGNNKSETEQLLISRLGNRIQNEKKCLDIDEELVATNIDNDDYSSVVFIKNKNHDDVASGTMQYYDWCESGKSKGKPQIWVNDLCRITTQKRSVSPVKALLVVFELIAAKYVKGIQYIHLMVDKEEPKQAEVLTKIYGKYGYTIVDSIDCGLDGDEYILMKKKIDRSKKFVDKLRLSEHFFGLDERNSKAVSSSNKSVNLSVKRESVRASSHKSKSKTLKVFSSSLDNSRKEISRDDLGFDTLLRSSSKPSQEKSKSKTPSPVKEETTPKIKTPSPINKHTSSL